MSKSAVLVGVIILAMLASFVSVVPLVDVAEAQEPFILNVSVQDETKNRNLVHLYFTTDVWTADVLVPVGGSLIQEHPETLERLPYVIVGMDVNGNRALDTAEIGVFEREMGTDDIWTAFFDVNGLRFHDGTDVEMMDILVSYHIESLAPGGDRFTKDLAGDPGSNYTADRWLWINPVPLDQTTGWLGAPPNPRQFALQFKQTGANAEFDRTTLDTRVLPAYWWQGTGERHVNGQVVATDIHPDWGWAVNPDTLNGVPVGGIQTDAGFLNEYETVTASEFDVQDQDVISTGAFRFVTWLPGQVARIEKNPDYFLPDPSVGQATLDAGLRVPALDVIIFRLFRNVQAGVFALQAGEVDFLDWFVPPEFVGPLLSDPNVGVITSADAGYFHITYNLRRQPFGYINPLDGSNIPGNDIGRPFRTAVAHAIDKATIVRSLLQNFAIPGHTVVSPTNTLYYNASAPRYAFDLALADSILDSYDVWDPSMGPCNRDGSGCRTFPGKGNALFEILTPQADYDPIRAAAGALIAQNLRAIGVNVDSRPTAFGQIVVKAFDEQDFDIFILGWSLTGFITPTYIDFFFHTRHDALSDNNAEGYRNATLDQIIDDARGATDQATAVRLWKQAQGIIASDLPSDVLYFRTNIFAFRQDRIDPASWRTDIGGDVYWFWSRILLDPAPAGLIRTSAVAPSALASGGTGNVVVTVRDADGNLLSDATVDFSVSSGPGSISPSSGTTDATGQFTATFTGPTLNPADTQAASFIQIQVTHPDLGGARTISVVITTFPPGASFLSLLVDTPFGNAVDEAASTILDVSVADETGLAAEGASVILTPSPTSATLTPSSFTIGASGRESVTFSAPAVDADTTFTIVVTASRQGVEGQTQITITVLDVPLAPAAPISGELILIIVGIVGVSAAGGGYAWWRRRRK